LNSSRLAQSAIFVATLVIGTQAHPVPLSYGTYYDESSSLGCGASVTFCRIEFSQLPLDKLLLLRKIHCDFTSGVPVSDSHLYIAATPGGNPIARNLPLQFIQVGAQTDGFFRYTVDMTTQWLVGQGRHPAVFFQIPTNTATMAGECTLIGDLVAPLQ
jgi:hypothetical protein